MQKHKVGLAVASRETIKRVTSLGGKTISRDRKHMAEIGRLGGMKNRKTRSVKPRK